MSNTLALPLYANKPQRRIPGTKAVAVTMYKSHDGSVAEYAVFSTDGEAYLGNAYFRPKRSIFPRSYATKSVPHMHDERFATLTEFALEMARRNGLDMEA